MKTEDVDKGENFAIMEGKWKVNMNIEMEVKLKSKIRMKIEMNMKVG